MKTLFEKYPARCFLFLTYTLSWSLWIPIALKHNNVFFTQTTFPPYFAGIFGPAIASIILTAFHAGREGVDQLIRRLFEFKNEAVWVAISILFPVSVWAGFTAIFGKTEIPSYYHGAHSNWIGVVLLAVFTWGFGGEPGWRGFLVPHLQKRNSALLTALMVAGVWCLWYWPLFFFHPQFTWMNSVDIGVWMIQMTALSFILTWLYNRSRGSLLSVCLCFAMLQIRPESAHYAAYIAVVMVGTALGLGLFNHFGKSPLPILQSENEGNRSGT